MGIRLFLDLSKRLQIEADHPEFTSLQILFYCVMPKWNYAITDMSFVLKAK